MIEESHGDELRSHMVPVMIQWPLGGRTEVEHSIPTYANNKTKRARRGFWKRSRYPELERC